MPRRPMPSSPCWLAGSRTGAAARSQGQRMRRPTVEASQADSGRGDRCGSDCWEGKGRASPTSPVRQCSVTDLCPRTTPTSLLAQKENQALLAIFCLLRDRSCPWKARSAYVRSGLKDIPPRVSWLFCSLTASLLAAGWLGWENTTRASTPIGNVLTHKFTRACKITHTHMLPTRCLHHHNGLQDQ